MVEVQIDAKQLLKLQFALRNIKNGVEKVMVPSINRSLDRGRTEIRREIRKKYAIKQKDIKIRIIGAALARLGGKIILEDSMLPLNKFKVSPPGVQKRKNKRVITATVRIGGGKQIPHGFVAQMPSGYIGPFVRAGKERLPIIKLLAISSPIMATQPGVGEVASKAMADSLGKEIDRNIRRILDKAKK